MEKVYKVKFMQYTNCLYDTVSDSNKDIGKRKYLNVGDAPFLVKESDLDKYKEYGNGYRSIEFVGYMKV